MQQPQRYTPDADIGLTAQQVRAREEDGLVNAQPPRVTKTVGHILRDNICTFFNAINAGIFVLLLLVHSYKNTLFMGVVLSNLLIGIIQELRAKRAVERLSVLNAPAATVVRDGTKQEVPAERVVLDDVVCMSPGQQVPVDAVVLTGFAEADESMLTGESDPQIKRAGDTLLSGSFIVAGSVCARAERVGAHSYAAQLAQQARRYRRFESQLMLALRRIIRFTGTFVLPLGALLFLRTFMQLHHALRDAIEQSAAAMLGMIPSGLMLLTSISLSAGVIALSRRRTLAQELSCIETLSRVDMLCLDKTGTLTTGDLRVQRLFAPDSGEEAAQADICALVRALPADNATSRALHARYAHAPAADYGAVAGSTPFSSARRYSAVSFARATLYIGAAQSLCPQLPPAFAREAAHAAAAGYRVLLLAKSDPSGAEPPPPEQAVLIPVCLVLLLDELRKDASDTLLFFREQGVSIKLISGDDARTVSAIAGRLGLPGYENYLDASMASEQELFAAAKTHTVFGRVSPQQKRTLLQALKAAGHTVAMTGDGVNDVLALKEADCSVALGAGSDAARQISQLVLLDNDFSALPHVVMEGRRVVNNITRTASLFLVKTVSSFFITASSVLLGFAYPFEPLQLTLIGALTVGIPSFFLALEPSRARIRGDFLREVLANALPGALCIALYTLLAGLAGRYLGVPYAQVNTLCVYFTGVVHLCVLLRVCLPLNRLRGVLFAVMAALFAIGVLLFYGPLELQPPAHTPPTYITLTLALACYPALSGLSRRARRILKMEA